jgi:sterol O-acyltransferase
MPLHSSPRGTWEAAPRRRHQPHPTTPTSSPQRPALLRVNSVPLVVSLADLLLPTTAMILLVFFTAFECVLNGAAELTRFGDRATYGAWWNASSFSEFSRQWNKPVHEFLLRHIYLDALRRQWRPAAALYLTYAVSIVAHEVVLWGGLSPVTPTPYLALLSLAQFPLMTLLRLPIFRGKRLGNAVFWVGLTFGVTLTLALYAMEVTPQAPAHARRG